MVTPKETDGRLELTSGKIYYRKMGQGAPVFLFHSLGTSSLAYQKFMPILAQRFAVYSWDMMGHGQSDMPPRDYSLEDYTDRMAEAIQALKLGPVAAIGNSIGAVMTVDLAARHPHLVSKIAPIGCPCWRDAKAREESLTASLAAFDEQGMPRPLSLEALSASFAHPTPELQQFMNTERSKAGRGAYIARIAVGKYDIMPRLGQVRCPALIVFGESDQLRSDEELLKQSIKDAQYAVIKNAGHITPVEAPEDLAAAVLPFLDS